MGHAACRERLVTSADIFTRKRRWRRHAISAIYADRLMLMGILYCKQWCAGDIMANRRPDEGTPAISAYHAPDGVHFATRALVSPAYHFL